jgi:hypothetical protein
LLVHIPTREAPKDMDHAQANKLYAGKSQLSVRLAMIYGGDTIKYHASI